MQVSMGMYILASKKIDNSEFERRMTEHAKWLKNSEEGERADFHDIDLSELDLSGRDFSYADMRGVNLMNSNLAGANLSYANLWEADLHNANLKGATVDGTIFMSANLTRAVLDECKGESTRFSLVCMWECSIKNAYLKKASFFDSKICDCDFSGSNLERAFFVGADFDDSVFENTWLCDAFLDSADRTYWTNFANSDMTGVSALGVDFNPANLKGVKGLYRPSFCPEEGSFIAWKKCRDGKIVKLLIPEHAERKGYSIDSCRASEAVVLEIYDKEGNSVDEAVSRLDPDFKYTKGKTVVPKPLDPNKNGDVTGVYFVLSRADAEAIRDLKDSEEDD